MAAKKLTPQQQRERRAKIMLGVLGAVLLLIVAIEVPSMLGGSKAASAPATTSSAVATTAPTSGSSLASVAVVATAQTGQLRSFSRFAAKDPFHALARTSVGGASSPSTSGAPPPSAKASSPATTKPPVPPAAPTVTFVQSTTTSAAPTGPMVLGAVMKLNGARRLIAVGTSFPAANPVFKLVAVGPKAIWISLIGGSFGAGQRTLKIERDHPVKLVNTTASVSYLLRLVRMTMLPKPAAPPASDTPAPSVATTTSSTTTTAPTTTTSASGG